MSQLVVSESASVVGRIVPGRHDPGDRAGRTSDTSSSRSTSSSKATPPPRTGAFHVMSHRARCSLAVAHETEPGVTHHIGRSTEQIDAEPHGLGDTADRQVARTAYRPAPSTVAPRDRNVMFG